MSPKQEIEDSRRPKLPQRQRDGAKAETELDLQTIADYLTGGPAMAYALRDTGQLSVVAHNGKKHLFSPDQVQWAQKQVEKPSKTPAGSPEPRRSSKTPAAKRDGAPKPATRTRKVATPKKVD